MPSFSGLKCLLALSHDEDEDEDEDDNDDGHFVCSQGCFVGTSGDFGFSSATLP